MEWFWAQSGLCALKIYFQGAVPTDTDLTASGPYWTDLQPKSLHETRPSLDP